MYRKILLAYDGSREGRLALREGALLARRGGAKVHLVAVVDPSVGVGIASSPDGFYVPPKDMSSDVKKVLDEGAERLTRLGLDFEVHLEKGIPVERITAVAKAVDADLVVVGHQRQNAVSRWLIGSVAAGLSDSLACSVLIARKDISDEVLFGRTSLPLDTNSS